MFLFTTFCFKIKYLCTEIPKKEGKIFPSLKTQRISQHDPKREKKSDKSFQKTSKHFLFKFHQRMENKSPQHTIVYSF